MPNSFEDDLMNLIDKHRDFGADLEEIMSALELRLYALREEEAEEND